MICSLGSMDECLLAGGDERLVLDDMSGLNRYGHGVRPLPRALAFGSSTASTVSPGAFKAVEALHRQLTEDLKTENEGTVYERGIASVRANLCTTLKLTDTEVIIAASGTGIHLLLPQLLVERSVKPLLVLAPQSSETGSGVGAALRGEHYVAIGCNGKALTKGARLESGSRAEVFEFAVRDAHGELRSEGGVEAELEKAISDAERSGRRCLLVVADVSKTGLIAPNLATVLRLQARWPDVVDVMIDACQFRLDPETIRAYLNHDFLVAIMGSKFLGGPIFSGALLCPPGFARRLRERPLPHSLGSYSVQGDWPTGWRARRSLTPGANWGLLLRWHAALFELTALHSISSFQRVTAAVDFCSAVQKRLKDDPMFAAMPVRPLDRSALMNDRTRFDVIPTIFPFVLQTPLRVLTAEETATVHRSLMVGAGERPVHLGQPVNVGRGRSALRICLSAPLLVRAARGPVGMRDVIGQAMEALDRTSHAVRCLTGDAEVFSRAAGRR